MVAALLKYVHEWRGLFLSSLREFSRISALEAEIQEIKEDKAKLFLKDSILSDKDKNLLATLAQAQISEREGEKELLESKVNIGLEPLAAKIDEQFKKEGTTQSVPNFKKILGLIAKAIEDEIRNSASPYPRYTTEQIILAFFCHKFNTKDDIQKLLSCLPNFVRDRLTLDSSVWTIKNIDSASNNPSDLDFIYAIQFMIGKIIKWISVNLFADCAEITIRHFTNIMLYNPIEQKFNVQHLAQIASPDYGRNLSEFYKQQTPDKANDGSPQFLNVPPSLEILYISSKIQNLDLTPANNRIDIKLFGEVSNFIIRSRQVFDKIELPRDKITYVN